MSYILTRQEASIILWISTRSVDRYIKWGKIRAKKIWRTVMLNEEDVDNIKTWDSNIIEIKQEVITPEQQSKEKQKNEEKLKTSIGKLNNDDISKIDLIYDDLRNEIKEKDKKIENLSLHLWKMEEVVKNSISMLEFKKSQFLLEESKNWVKNELEKSKLEQEKLKIKLEEKSKLNIILAILIVILFMTSLGIWWFSV
jgi:hypothetical protein